MEIVSVDPEGAFAHLESGCSLDALMTSVGLESDFM